MSSQSVGYHEFALRRLLKGHVCYYLNNSLSLLSITMCRMTNINV